MPLLPSKFAAAIAAAILFSWQSPRPESTTRDGTYSDLISSLHNNTDIYFMALPPTLLSPSSSSFHVDPTSYNTVEDVIRQFGFTIPAMLTGSACHGKQFGVPNLTRRLWFHSCYCTMFMAS